MRVQCDEAKGTRQQERAQRTDKCLTGHLAPALQAARYTNFLAGLGLTGAAEGVLESHSSSLGQHPCDCGYVSFLSLHLLLNKDKNFYPAGPWKQ